jgi:hypothetical protein
VTARYPHASTRRRVSIALTALVAFSCTGCFYFDSRWLDAQDAKKRQLAHARPAALAVHDSKDGTTQVAVVRAYATRAYAAETVNASPRRR